MTKIYTLIVIAALSFSAIGGTLQDETITVKGPLQIIKEAEAIMRKQRQIERRKRARRLKAKAARRQSNQVLVNSPGGAQRDGCHCATMIVSSPRECL